MTSIKAAAAPPQMARDVFAMSLSAGAGVIHLAVAPSHVEPLGDLALGFYWAALFQIAFAVALFARPGSRRLVRVGVGVNLALIATWACSRTIGLPTIPGGPEPLGLADATTVAFQIALVCLLVARSGDLGTRVATGRPAASLGPIARSALILGVGVVGLSTVIAMADGVSGHGHGHGATIGAAHAHPQVGPGVTEPDSFRVAPHGHGDATEH
jgi:hypothetical protein